MDCTDKQILIVENDFASAYLLMESFCHTGAKFIYVSSVEATLDICRNCSVNLVVTSSRLKGTMRAVELTKQIKLNHPEIPVLVYSSDAEIGNINDFYTAGCDYIILKPVNLEHLNHIFYTYLNTHSEFQGSLNILKHNNAYLNGMEKKIQQH